MLMPTMRTNVFDDLFNTPFFTKSESSMMKTTAKTITPFFNVYICNLLLSCFVGIVFLYSNPFLKNEKRFEYYKNVRNICSVWLHYTIRTNVCQWFWKKKQTFVLNLLLFTHTCPVTKFAVASHLNTANFYCHHLFLRYFRFQKCRKKRWLCS